jgi:hypothetical protein
MIQNVNTVFTLFIIAVCLVFAYFIAFTDLMADKMQGNSRHIFVGVMLSYAAFRSYRLVKMFKEKNNENQE